MTHGSQIGRRAGGPVRWQPTGLRPSTIWRRLADASAQNRGVTYSVAKLRQGSCPGDSLGVSACWLLISCKTCTWLVDDCSEAGAEPGYVLKPEFSAICV